MAQAPRVHRLDEVVSTMDEARALAAAGVPHGTAVTARLQTGGRGRGGRRWVSPPGNLYATVVLRPDGGARRAPELGFVVALALAEAVDALAGPGTALKWPNDVLRDGAKLAGILLDYVDEATVLAGVGVNVAHQPDGMPYPVTSLRKLGCLADAEGVLHVLLARLDVGWAAWQADGLAPVLTRWRARGPALGASMRVRMGSDTIRGVFAGLGVDGTLLLDTAAGRRTLLAGEVLL